MRQECVVCCKEATENGPQSPPVKVVARIQRDDHNTLHSYASKSVHGTETIYPTFKNFEGKERKYFKTFRRKPSMVLPI